MTSVLLFCIAEQAKPFIRKAQSVEVGGIGLFYIVESHNVPSDGQKLKQVLADNESFETDFIGASEQHCREWALEKQFQNNTIEQDLIAIADQRSAEDDTLSIHFYNSGPNLEFGRFGILPREENTWYVFRVYYKEVDKIFNALSMGPFNIVYPIYFGCKDELTDERGIFNVSKAEELCLAPPPM